VSEGVDLSGGLAEVALLPEELEIRETARAVVADVIAPQAAEVDASSLFPEEGLRALAGAGLGGLLIPAKYGGGGRSSLAYAVAMEEIAAACPSTSTVYMTQMHCAWPILLAGTAEQRERWLPALCDATALGSLGVTEPGAGSDVSGIRTVARAAPAGYRVSGTKTFITTGDRADVLILFATVDPARGRDGLTAFLTAREDSPWEPGPPMHKLGMRGSSTAELFFDETFLPTSARLGGEGEAWALSMQSVVKSRLSASAQGVGIARGAIEAATSWAQLHGLTRGSAGRAQEVQFALAEAMATVAAARSLLHLATRLADTPNDDVVPAISMAKLVCTDCAMEVSKKMVGLLGEDGDRAEHGVERFLRDAKATQIYDGTNQIQRLLIARLLPAPAVGDDV
jgi:alkylation response protein AidB-like acyl-CoA dehydrogenase